MGAVMLHFLNRMFLLFLMCWIPGVQPQPKPSPSRLPSSSISPYTIPMPSPQPSPSISPFSCSAPYPDSTLHMVFPNCGTMNTGSVCNGRCQVGYSMLSSVNASCISGSITYFGQCRANFASCSSPTSSIYLHMEFPNCGAIASGNYCDGQCEAGYVLSSRVYASCTAGSPIYYGQCNPAGCSAPSPPKSFHMTFPNCWTIASGSYCYGQCQTGYSSSSSVYASCTLGTWVYRGECTTGYLDPARCDAPSYPNALHMLFPCVKFVSGSSCDGQCEAGYESSSSVYASCTMGILTYHGQCTEARCGVPTTNDLHMAFPNCGTIASGSYCYGQCQAGYESSSVFASCTRGRLTYYGQCTAAHCGIPYPANDLHMVFPYCGTIDSGYYCYGQCQAGYESSSSIYASCTRGILTYYGQCTSARCAVPSYPNDLHMAFPNCGAIASGSSCDGQCQAGYSSSSRVYAFCTLGSLTYYGQCTAGARCGVPSPANALHMAFPNCGTIASGSYCYGQCQAGYSASSSVYASCTGSSLTYYGQCTAGAGCGAPSPADALHMTFPNCGTIASGSYCDGQC
eukprot:EG_transcript_8159